MSWTNISDTTSWQNLQIAKEIAVAYNKRAAACGENTLETDLGVSAVDNSVSVYDFVLACQTGLETMATKYADPDDDVMTSEGESSYPQNYQNVADMMSDAGLTKSGYWRRIADAGDNPSPWSAYTGYSYGKIMSKDLAGPWLFKDIQLVLTALTRRIITIDPDEVDMDSGSFGSYQPPDVNVTEHDDPAPLYPSGLTSSYPETRKLSFIWYKRRQRETVDDGGSPYSTFFFNDICIAWKNIPELTSEKKDITLIIMPGTPSTYTYYDWGYDWTPDETNIFATWTDNTSATVAFSINLESSFSDLYSTQDTAESSIADGFILRDARAVVDFKFNP